MIQVQPAEGIQLHFQTKVPDAGMKLRQTDLDFQLPREFRGAMPEAYERLLLDALNGDASLFARSDEVEVAWSIIDPILAAWQALPLRSWKATHAATGARRRAMPGCSSKGGSGSMCARSYTNPTRKRGLHVNSAAGHRKTRG